jgi:DNA-binding NarL/FixJ family response regulator
MDSQRPLRVLIIDDHDLFRTGLQVLLQDEGMDVAEAESAPAGIRRGPSFDPDVVVMDLNMPEMCGIEATPLILDAAPRASVLVLTIATDDARVLRAIRAGASGYLLKDAPLDEIAAGIRAAAQGHSAIAPRVAGAILESLRSAPSADEPAPPRAGTNLTRREREVLRMLALGYDNAEIADRLYMSPGTVKSHVSRLLDKLCVNNRVQAAAFAIRNGLAEPDGAEISRRPSGRRPVGRTVSA